MACRRRFWFAASSEQPLSSVAIGGKVAMYSFEFTVVLRNLPYLLEGIAFTLLITVGSLVIGLIIGLFLAIFRLSKMRGSYHAATAYIEFFRNTPVLVQLIWFFFCIPILTGQRLTPIVAAILALGLNAGASMAEIFRAGIQAVPRGQVEAAISLGLPRSYVYRFIVLPQAVRLILPPMGNAVISLLKDSSLASVIAVGELMRRAEDINSATYRPLEIYTIVALVYFILTFAVSRVFAGIEKQGAIRT
jgi:His/Glu/Gln/Arg/opine family amino acid ABC transporter permease subunit